MAGLSVLGMVAASCASNNAASSGSGGAGGNASGSGSGGAGSGGAGNGSGGAGGASATTGTGGNVSTDAGTDGASTDGNGSTGTGGAVGSGGNGGNGGNGGSKGSGGTTDAGSVDTHPITDAGGDSGGQVAACPATGLGGAGQVRITKSGATFAMTRDGAPYYIKGIAGGSNLVLAHDYGVNSTRTFGSDGAMGILDGAKSNCMTVLMGIGLSQTASDYTDPAFTNGKKAEVTNLLATIKNHPSLLMWALGNEINLGADTQDAWTFVGQLAQMIHAQDPNHPVITVIAGANVTAINHVVQWSPGIDAIGINSYAAVVNVNNDIKPSTFTGPVIITEWGPTGHWESPITAWNRPIEETSGAKSRVYKTRYDSFAHTGRILGDYVFLWGQKIERTPTWYGMFLETNSNLGLMGESLATVDTMSFEWSGAYPSNRAPDVTAFTLNGKVATDSVTLTSGQTVTTQVTATDPDGDSLSFAWEILQDPEQPDLKGGPEDREPRVGAPVKGTSPMLSVKVPTQAGQYRIFVYALDGKGHGGTANIPFKVN
ncbi:MAG TPA: glycoside hydrolase family 2 TIM barrel-domain containing protein [Polyangia bacterium]